MGPTEEEKLVSELGPCRQFRFNRVRAYLELSGISVLPVQNFSATIEIAITCISCACIRQLPIHTINWNKVLHRWGIIWVTRMRIQGKATYGWVSG